MNGFRPQSVGKEKDSLVSAFHTRAGPALQTHVFSGFYLASPALMAYVLNRKEQIQCFQPEYADKRVGVSLKIYAQIRAKVNRGIQTYLPLRLNHSDS